MVNLPKRPTHGRLHIFRERLVLEKTLMEMVSHEISFSDSIISIVDGKERDLFLFDICFCEVSDNTYSILVVGQLGSWMRVGRISFNYSIALR